MRINNRFVYILRSVSQPERHYVGATSRVPGRLGFHNAGLSRHTAKYRPWELVVAVEFPTEQKAIRLETARRDELPACRCRRSPLQWAADERRCREGWGGRCRSTNALAASDDALRRNP